MSTTPPPSPWRRVDRAVPLHAWRDAQLEPIALRLQAALDAWREDWGLGNGSFEVTCAALQDPVEGSRWTVLGARNGAIAWVDGFIAVDETLARALLDVDHPTTPVARGVFQRCRADGLARLANALALEPEGVAEHAPPSGRWTGAVQAILPWGMRVLINHAAVQALAPASERASAAASARLSTALAGIAEALGNDTLSLSVQLADCELDVGSLQDLRVGDVVRARHPVDRPLRVLHGDGEPLFTGHLVRRGAFKAIELADVLARELASPGKAHP